MPHIPSAVPPSIPHKTTQADAEIIINSKSSFKAKPMTWLKMNFTADEATKLWQAISQSVNREIQRDKEKSLKAIRNFGKEAEDQEN